MPTFVSAEANVGRNHFAGWFVHATGFQEGQVHAVLDTEEKYIYYSSQLEYDVSPWQVRPCKPKQSRIIVLRGRSQHESLLRWPICIRMGTDLNLFPRHFNQRESVLPK
jgi:hypothetical protein